MLTSLFGQLVLRGQSFGSDDWANLLFIVVMAVLWLGAGLVKTIGRKGPGQGRPEPGEAAGRPHAPSETWQQRLARKAEELQRRLEEQAGAREPRGQSPPAQEPAVRPPQVPRGKIAVRPGQRGESVLVYERPQAQSPTPREPQVDRRGAVQETVVAARRDAPVPRFESSRWEAAELTIEGIPPLMVEPPRPQDPGALRGKAAQESARPEMGPFVDYSDPEVLRKAILHYEILGRPLALRETLDPTSDF